MTNKKKPSKPQKKHIKMYASDELIKRIQGDAEKMGVSQSTYLLMAVNEYRGK